MEGITYIVTPTTRPSATPLSSGTRRPAQRRNLHAFTLISSFKRPVTKTFSPRRNTRFPASASGLGVSSIVSAVGGRVLQ